MFSPRNLIIAGVVLVAIALGSSGHGLWWLVGFFWVLPHFGGRGHVCGGASRRRRDDRAGAHGPLGDGSNADDTVAQPDPTHDRHEAFPVR